MVPSITRSHLPFNWTSIICLHTVKWPNSSISNNSIKQKSWQWKYSAFPKLQHYWSLTIRLFSDVSKMLIGRILPLRRDVVSLQPQQTGRLNSKFSVETTLNNQSAFINYRLLEGEWPNPICSKRISIMWNVNCLVKDLNLDQHVHFPGW